MSEEEGGFDENYSVYLADDKYGSVEIAYKEAIDEYMIQADFRRAGDTVMVLEFPDGDKREYDVHIERDTYTVSER